MVPVTFLIGFPILDYLAYRILSHLRRPSFGSRLSGERQGQDSLGAMRFGRGKSCFSPMGSCSMIYLKVNSEDSVHRRPNCNQKRDLLSEW